MDVIPGSAYTLDISCLWLFGEMFKSASNSATMSRPEGWTHVCEYHLPPCNVPSKIRDCSLLCDISFLCPLMPPVTVIREERVLGRQYETQVVHGSLANQTARETKDS